MQTTAFTLEPEELKKYEYEFHLLPSQWDRYAGPTDLEWKCVRFDEQSVEDVPNAAGVYAFCVRPSIGGNLCGSYLLYVGQTERGLRTRCKEYLRKASSGVDRPRIQRMLNLYYSTKYLHFCFAVVSDSDDPKSIEASLLEACVPPVNKIFPASVRDAVGAF